VDYALALAGFCGRRQRRRGLSRSRRRVAENLAAADDRLDLVGPSGGWCLPTEVLARWAARLVIDLDPLSPLLLRLRHGLRAELDARTSSRSCRVRSLTFRTTPCCSPTYSGNSRSSATITSTYAHV
jgi:hypothetical protein